MALRFNVGDVVKNSDTGATGKILKVDHDDDVVPYFVDFDGGDGADWYLEEDLLRDGGNAPTSISVISDTIEHLTNAVVSSIKEGHFDHAKEIVNLIEGYTKESGSVV